MARTVGLDELHLIVRVTADLPARAATAIRRALVTPRFANRLRFAARDALAAVPSAGAISVRVAVRPGR
jgi:hypothetical protein